ncbi:hypothetical protein NPIRD3C_0371 [Nitrosopumilus piranensis]|uniref:HTH iclR-type domain-containing protein n=1 Tax=Nitrosopumilus piranensis TaxID=1582439 RepID=A0A0C5C8Q9_9ARCH|nr:hypothetical protein NPIRD3C_0371 [Nitrosopumilus piranensis]
MKSENHFDYCNEILLNIQKFPKSAKEISAETKIPITTVYKMIRLLESHELIMASGILHRYGKRRLFQCNGDFKSAHIKLHRIFQIEFA